ncbi:MAG: dephospho-CoA kinase, partial [Gammaproteobacteria bacterium]
MLRIGLTGGIASGKSTISAMFAELGAEVIDTDEIAHELVAPGGGALAAVIDAFGSEVQTPDGGLDRRRMRQIVFDDAAQRRRLEAILHPEIRRIALARAASSEAPYVILVVPLLFESGFDELVDRTIAVDCPVSRQIERLVERDATTPEQAHRIVAAQMGRDERTTRADDVIDSDCPLDVTRRRVRELHAKYLAESE